MLCSSATQLYTRPRQGSKRTSLAAATSQAANSAALCRNVLPAARSMVEHRPGQPRCCFTRAEKLAALHEVRGWLLRFAAQPSSSSGPYVVPRSSSGTIGEGEEQSSGRGREDAQEAGSREGTSRRAWDGPTSASNPQGTSSGPYSFWTIINHPCAMGMLVRARERRPNEVANSQLWLRPCCLRAAGAPCRCICRLTGRAAPLTAGGQYLRQDTAQYHACFSHQSDAMRRNEMKLEVG